ncbi:hypothetical protein A2U01_0058171, partial [Trifolium medium]|nr:hypothetical protein [Trifolium medium]
VEVDFVVQVVVHVVLVEVDLVVQVEVSHLLILNKMLSNCIRIRCFTKLMTPSFSMSASLSRSAVSCDEDDETFIGWVSGKTVVK